MLLLIALFLIGLKAVYDVARHTGKTKLFNTLDFCYKVLIPMIALAWASQQSFLHVREHRYWVLVIGYVLVYFAVFDIVYNAVKGTTPLDYIGTTKRWDRFLRSLKLHPSLLLLIRGIAFIWGSSWLLGWMDGIIDIAKSIF